MEYPHLYIGGKWVPPRDGGMLASIDPATGRTWARVAFGGPKDVDAAVAAARDAFGPWSRRPGHERAALLRRFAELYASAAPDLARLESQDNGRALRESRADIGSHATAYHWWASLADKNSGRTIPLDDQVHAFTTRVPVGVVGAITPWNVPLMAALWKLGPALASGCTVVLKPAEQTPVTSLELGKLFERAGFPPGVVNVVPGYGKGGAGERLAAHPDVNKIAFTGEGSTARAILRSCGDRAVSEGTPSGGDRAVSEGIPSGDDRAVSEGIPSGDDSFKRFTFELGGKAAHIIFSDANFDQAINAATGSAWALCGQSCALGSRVLVQRSLYERVVNEFAQRAARVRVGMPLLEQTHMGPQAHAEQLEKTLSYIDIGKGEGADLVAGGKRITSQALAQGYFVEPTVFANVTNGMRIAREEIFGPVAALIPFDDEEEAISLANDTPYGLTAGLWTQDVGRALRVSSRIEAGMVWVNTYRYIRWSTPYGGFKASGWGRENGLEGLDAYLDTRTTIVSTTGRFPDPFAS